MRTYTWEACGISVYVPFYGPRPTRVIRLVATREEKHERQLEPNDFETDTLCHASPSMSGLMTPWEQIEPRSCPVILNAEDIEQSQGIFCNSSTKSLSAGASTASTVTPRDHDAKEDSLDYVREWIASIETCAGEDHKLPEEASACASSVAVPASKGDNSIEEENTMSCDDVCNGDNTYVIGDDEMQAHVSEALRGLRRLEEVVAPSELPTVRALFIRWTIANWEHNISGHVRTTSESEEPTNAWIHDLQPAYEATSHAAASRRPHMPRRTRSRGINKHSSGNIPLGHVHGPGSCVVKARSAGDRQIISLSRSYDPTSSMTGSDSILRASELTRGKTQSGSTCAAESEVDEVDAFDLLI